MEPVEGLSAVTLHVADMARSVSFYRALGFAPVDGGEHPGFSSFRAGGSFLNLQLVAGWRGEPGARGRANFWVADVDAMHRRAVAAGFEPVMAPSDAPWGERYFHLRDPDGHELSFARPL